MHSKLVYFLWFSVCSSLVLNHESSQPTNNNNNKEPRLESWNDLELEMSSKEHVETSKS